MKTWKLNAPKDRFIELLKSCVQEPQLVCDQDEPIAVVVDIALFKALTEFRKRQSDPTIAELLDELSEIEPIDIELPTRQD